MKICIIWNKETNTIVSALSVPVNQGPPLVGNSNLEFAVISVESVPFFKAGFADQGYPESEIAKIDSAAQDAMGMSFSS